MEQKHQIHLNNENTTQLSKIQEINDNPNEQNKPQMIRFHQRLIRISKQDFIELKKATKYILSIDQEGEDVHQKIIQGFIDKLIDYQSNVISWKEFTILMITRLNNNKKAKKNNKLCKLKRKPLKIKKIN